MLNIHSIAKNLFKRDGVRKNIRIHFPNGELPDITNANIVRESVTFSESVCSQDVLKYGLTEASIFEFETVGIWNMYGMTIEVGVEIDTSSLTAADLTTLGANQGDGVLVLAQDSDIGFGYFRIPLGQFRVHSCPRNHEAMTHRKVTAYTQTITASQGLPYLEGKKLAAKGSVNTMTVNARRQAMAIMAQGDESTLASNGFTKTLVGDDTAFYTMPSSSATVPSFITGLAHAVTVSFSAKRGSLGTSITDHTEAQDAIFTLQVGKYATVFPQIVEYFRNLGSTAPEAKLRFAMLRGYSQLVYESIVNTGAGNQPIPVEKDEVVYPRRGGMEAQFIVPTSVTLTYDGVSTTITPTGSDPAAIYKWTDDNANSAAMTFAPAGSGYGGQANWYTFNGVFEADKLVNGYLELFGDFGKASRTGGWSVIQLDNSNPESITPSDTEELWYDEYDVSPVGTVVYKIGEEEFTYEFGGGLSVYDLTDNFVIQYLDGATESTVNALLDATLIPALEAVNFTPVELHMRAMPWIEAGDALQITTEDGEVVNTFAMSHAISGIQMLQATIESSGGELVEV